jgi:hypothetical protein
MLVLLGAAACSGDADGGDPGGSGGGRPGGGAGGELVVIDISGGLLPPGALFSEVPVVAVYADGTAVVPAPVNGSFPGPAVQPLATGTLDEATVADLVQHAADAGLLRDKVIDLDTPGADVIADGPTTTIHLVVDGETHDVSAYALGLVTPESGDRAAAAAFVASVRQAAEAAAVDDYDPTGYRVLPSEPYEGEAGVTPNTVDWPAGLPELALGGCVVVDGDAADTLEGVLGHATQITRWLQGEDAFALSIRPLLPHEGACER